jgi:hypothetical protein
MKRSVLLSLTVVAAAAALTACSDSTNPTLAESDAQLTADVAASAGDAIATDVGEMIINEGFAGLPAATLSFDLFGAPPGVSVTRSRTCYDDQDQVQAQCDSLTTSYIVFTMTLDGSFSRAHDGPRGSETMSVAVHRARTLTVSGLLGHETSRQHDGDGASSDTTEYSGTFGDVTITRTLTVAALDSVQAVVFDLPRLTNPWPVSGTIVRNVSGTVTVTGGANEGTRSFTRRISVVFPADAQGNVTLYVNNNTCTLNLVTHAVTNCTS